MSVAMPKNHVNNVIRMIKTQPLTSVKALRYASFRCLKRIGVKRNMSKAVRGTPDGSDQGELMSIILWFDKVQKNDKQAIRQAVAIDATAVARMEV